MRLRNAALLAMAVVLAACANSSPQSSSTKLASDQTLRFAIFKDVGSLDPVLANNQAAVNIDRQVFDGLYRADETDKIVPDIASAMPSISTDGTTYTIPIRHDVKFSNGDAVTSADVVYSWTRNINLNGQDTSYFEGVVGYASAVKGGPLTGITAPDAYSVVIKLTQRSGPFDFAIAHNGVSIVDKKVVDSLGKNWAATANGLVGTGPFKLVAYSPGASLDFAPVPHWWNGSTGTLTKVHIEILNDLHAGTLAYQSGGLDVDGGDLHVDPLVADIQTFLNDPNLKSQVRIYPTGNTGYLGFNFNTGPLSGDAGLPGRQALSMAIDRNALALAACNNVTCNGQTGGWVPPTSPGYLGKDADPSAKFDPTAAKALLKQWDPDGTKVKRITLMTYNPAIAQAAAQNIQSQWMENLGINVPINQVDISVYLQDATARTCNLFILANLNPNYPSFYYHTFDCEQAKPGNFNLTSWCNPTYDSAVNQGDGLPLSQALSYYKQAADIRAQQVPFSVLYNTTTVMFIKPYVSGAGRGKSYINDWANIRILQH